MVLPDLAERRRTVRTAADERDGEADGAQGAGYAQSQGALAETVTERSMSDINVYTGATRAVHVS